jgi:septal ring factor EnvC (AmiA/AmiB activator)
MLRTSAEEVLVPPRARSLAVALAGVLAVASLVARPALADDKRSDLSRTRDRLGQVEAVLRNARADAVAVDAALAEAQRATAEGQQRLDAARTRLAAARQRRLLAERALQRVSADVDGLRGQIDARARNLYISGGSADLVALMEPEHLPDLVDRAVTLDYVAESGANTLARLRGGQRLAASLQARMVAAERDSSRAAAAVASEVAALRQVQAVRERAKRALDAKLARLAGQAASLRAHSEELRRLIRQEEQARRRAAAARAAARTANDPPQVGRVAGGRCDLSGTSTAELWIIMHESGGYPTADNPTSTAFGLGQLLLGNRILYLGNDYATIDCGKQLFAFRAYVRDRYGTAEAAQAFWQANGWY